MAVAGEVEGGIDSKDHLCGLKFFKSSLHTKLNNLSVLSLKLICIDSAYI